MTSHDSPRLGPQGGGVDMAMVEAEGSTGTEYNEDERGEGGAGQGGGWGAGGLTPLECVVETEPGTDAGAGKRSQGLSNHESPSHPYHPVS